MANFDKLAELGKPIFLQHDQEALLRKYRLEADSRAIYVRYCGARYAIDRVTADVTDPDGKPAGPAVTLAIFDMLCHSERLLRPPENGAPPICSPAAARAIPMMWC